MGIAGNTTDDPDIFTIPYSSPGYDLILIWLRARASAQDE